MKRLFFVINQDLRDDSAHALYCFRHSWWLARTAPEKSVIVLCPGRSAAEGMVRHFGFDPLLNHWVVGRPAVRRAKHGRGITLNSVFYWSAYWYVSRRLRQGDGVLIASFPKLGQFLFSRPAIRRQTRLIYEIHQLALLEDTDRPKIHREVRREEDVVRLSDQLVTTTASLQSKLKQIAPGKPVHNAGLACGFDPNDFPARIGRETEGKGGKPVFTFAYIGSIYPEQGVEWLIEQWPYVQASQKEPLCLKVIGGNEKTTARLRRRLSESGLEGVTVHGAIPPRRLAGSLNDVDALIIPALRTGRMPHVALTKAYDYLGLNRPILAADLPPVAEVVRHEREGLLFSPGNRGHLIQMIDRLMADPKLAEQLTERAAQRARELSWKERAATWWKALERNGLPDV